MPGSQSQGDAPRLREAEQASWPRMIFVCGCGHSGTSLVTAMLGAHPGIYAINEETGLFVEPDLTPTRVREIFQTKYLPKAAEKGARFLCEKTPAHVHHLDRIRAAFPDALVVIPIRDARDVALSIKRRTGSLRDGYLRWLRDNVVVQRQQLAPTGHTCIFRYEDLISDVDGMLRTLCGLLEIQYDPVMLQYHQDPRAWFGASKALSSAPPTPREHVEFRNWQIKQPVMERRGQWKTHLTRSEIAEVQDACGPLMQYFGYRFEGAETHSQAVPANAG